MQKFKEIHGSGPTTLIISNEEMNDIMKIFQALEDSIILLKEIKNNRKQKKRTKRRFLGMLLGTLGAILLGNMFTGKGILRAGCGNTFF